MFFEMNLIFESLLENLSALAYSFNFETHISNWTPINAGKPGLARAAFHAYDLKSTDATVNNFHKIRFQMLEYFIVWPESMHNFSL